MDLDKTTFEELVSFPSYLHSLEDVKKLSKLRLKQTIDRILPDINTYDIDMEIVRDYNLVAFFFILLNEKEKASEFIAKTLLKSPENINCLVLKSWLYLKANDLYESKKVLIYVKPLKGNKRELIFAKAELAYMYTRLGIQFYSIGEMKYEKLFQEIEVEKIIIEPNIYANWQFGQGLIMKRLLNVNNLYEENTFDITVKRLRHIFKHYKAIVNKENIDNKLRARSLIEMGELTRSDLAKDFPDAELFEHPQEYYFQEAIALDGSDPFVLERCGRHLKYKNVDQSIELLKKSLSIRNSSYAQHHLALAMKRKLLFDQRSKSTTRGYSNVSCEGITYQLQGASRGSYSYRRNNSRRARRGFPSKEGSFLSTASSDSGFQSFELSSRHSNRFKIPHKSANMTYSRVSVGVSTRNWVQSEHFDQSSSLVSDFSTLSITENYMQRSHRGYPRRSSQGRLGARNRTRCGDGRWRKHNRSNSTESNQGSGGTNRWIKSPKTVESISEDNANTAEDILSHLDEAYKINGNIAALYDKGLIFRALRRYDDAIEIFKLFMGRVPSSLVYLANAYEQSALCLKEKAEELREGEKTQETLEKIAFNQQYFLSAFIEISYNKLLVKCPDLVCTSTSVEMLEQLLNEKERTKDTVKELSDLYSRIREYSKANESLHELLKLEENIQKQHDIQMRLIRNHVDHKRFDEAILASEVLGYDNIDTLLYREVHLDGAFESYMKGEFMLAKLRLKRALRRDAIYTDVDDEVGNELFDIFTLSSDSLETPSRNVADGLKKLGIGVTVNFDDLGIFDSPSAIIKVMQRSTYFIVFVDFENKSDGNRVKHDLETIRALYDERNYGNILLLTENELAKIPANFKRFPSLVYDQEKELETSPISDCFLNWLKKLLWCCIH